MGLIEWTIHVGAAVISLNVPRVLLYPYIDVFYYCRRYLPSDEKFCVMQFSMLL